MKKFDPVSILLSFLLSLDISFAYTICGQANDGEPIADFAVVQASDGYVNVRQDNKVIGKLSNEEVVFIFESVIEVRFADKTVKLPKHAYQNLFNPILSGYGNLAISVNYDQKNDTLYIHMSNIDRAGSYNALLVLKNKKFYKQYIGLGF